MACYRSWFLAISFLVGLSLDRLLLVSTIYKIANQGLFKSLSCLGWIIRTKSYWSNSDRPGDIIGDGQSEVRWRLACSSPEWECYYRHFCWLCRYGLQDKPCIVFQVKWVKLSKFCLLVSSWWHWYSYPQPGQWTFHVQWQKLESNSSRLPNKRQQECFISNDSGSQSNDAVLEHSLARATSLIQVQSPDVVKRSQKFQRCAIWYSWVIALYKESWDHQRLHDVYQRRNATIWAIYVPQAYLDIEGESSFHVSVRAIRVGVIG